MGCTQGIWDSIRYKYRVEWLLGGEVVKLGLKYLGLRSGNTREGDNVTFGIPDLGIWVSVK